MTLWFQKWNWVRNWVNFEKSKRSETLYFDGLILFKAYSVLARKFQRNYVS